jgi:hypothetical protein
MRLPDGKAEKSIETLAAENPAVAVRGWRACDQPVLQPLMVSLAVVVRQELRDRSPQMALAQRHQSIEAFTLDRQDEPLGERVEVRASSGQSHHLHPASLERISKVGCVERIPVEQKVALPHQEAVFSIE